MVGIAAFNIAANLIFIPVHGILAASMVTVVSNIAAFAILVSATFAKEKKIMAVFLLKGSIISAVLFLLARDLANAHILVFGAVLLLTTLALRPAAGILTKQDRTFMISFFKNR